jgi:flagellar basal body rod protein FlgB
MIQRLFGPGTRPANLRADLTATAQQVRNIAHRVANAGNADFEAQLMANGQEPVDLEAEMVKLADAQLRFDASARLLQKSHQGLRTAIRERS